MADIDADDPATWPEDEEGLLKLAEQATAEEPPPPPDPDPEEPAPEESPPPVEEPTPEEPAEADGEPIEGVLSKNGKHIIPFSVFDGLQRTTKQLRDELEALKAQQQPAPAPAPPGETPMWQRSQEEINTYLDDIREEYGDKVADQEQRLLAMEADWSRERAAKDEAQASQAAQAARSIQEAIEATPKLFAWQQEAQTAPWYDHAQKVHGLLLDEPAYRDLTPAQQMAQLVTKVEALYGPSPHRIQPAPAAAPRSPAKAMRTSISEIPGGVAADDSGELPMENMTDGQLNVALSNMSLEGIDALLRRIS